MNKDFPGQFPELLKHIQIIKYCCARQKRKDDLNRSSLPLFRQGVVTVGLTTRLRAERDQGGFTFIGRFVEAIRETLIRWDILSILLLR